MTLRQFHVCGGIVTVVLSLLLIPQHNEAAGTRIAALAGLRLIMVEEYGCRFCRRWDADVGYVYDKSTEGRRAPLHRVRRESPVLSGLKPVVYTPTFILTRDGQEIGRITGYPGESYFWEELGELLDSAGPAAGAQQQQNEGP